MQIVICDDEPKMLSDIAKKVAALLPEGELRLFSSGGELLSCLDEKLCDILLLDIDMPEITGLQVARELSALQKKPLLVFVTSHDELVYDSFQYHPFAFLRKSRFDEEIEKILQDCVRELGEKDRHFCFRSEGKDVRLLLADILYFEAEGNYLKVVTAKEDYRFRSTLSAVEHALQNFGFLRIHKGFFINQAAVKLLNSEEATLQNNMTLPIGKSYTKTVRIVFFTGLRDFGKTVRSGGFDRFILRPRGLLFQLIFSDADWFAAIGRGGLGVVLFVISAGNVGITWNIGTILYYVFTVIGGVLIQGAIFLFLATLNIYLLETNSLKELFYWDMRRFAGYPISIFHKAIQFCMIYIVPFAFVNYFPARFIFANRLQI